MSIREFLQAIGILIGIVLLVILFAFMTFLCQKASNKLFPSHEKCGYIIGEKFVFGDRHGYPHYQVFVGGSATEVTSQEYAAVKTGDTVCVTWSYSGYFESLRVQPKN